MTDKPKTDDPSIMRTFRDVRAWDLAFTAKTDACYSATVRLRISERSDLIIADSFWFQAAWHDVRASILETAKLDGGGTALVLPTGGQQAGVTEDIQISDEFSFVDEVALVSERGDKLSRALRWITWLNPKNKVFICRDTWGNQRGCTPEQFLAYVCRFTGHDDPSPIMDIIDAISMAYGYIAGELDEGAAYEQSDKKERLKGKGAKKDNFLLDKSRTNVQGDQFNVGNGPDWSRRLRRHSRRRSKYGML